MQAGVTGRIINIHLAVIVRNGTVGKHNVGHIAHALPAAGGNQEPGRLGNDLPRFLEVGHKNIDDIPQPCRRVAHAVGNVQPALVGFDGGRTLAVLGFGDGVVAAGGGDDLLIHNGGSRSTLRCCGLRLVTRLGRRSHVFRSLVRTIPAAATAALRSGLAVSLLSEQKMP